MGPYPELICLAGFTGYHCLHSHTTTLLTGTPLICTMNSEGIVLDPIWKQEGILQWILQPHLTLE